MPSSVLRAVDSSREVPMIRVPLPRVILTIAILALVPGAGCAQSTATPSRVVAQPRAITIESMPARAVALQAELSPILSPTVRSWVAAKGREIAQRNPPLDGVERELRRAIVARFPSAGLADGDINAIAVLILMEAADTSAVQARPVTPQGRSVDLKRTRDTTVRNRTDSMTELAEERSLRLQMAMDRRASLEQTLSNILKKMSSTSQEIIGNLK